MIKKPKILLIIEGIDEDLFFNKIQEIFDLNISIVAIRGNIYKIYNKMEKENFNCNIKKLMEENIPNDLTDLEKQEYVNKLRDTYSDIYFIFDFDIQHHEKDEINNIETNCQKIAKMLKELNNETDDTRGKLFINYPMMESYRDIDCFDDKNFSTRSISVNVLIRKKYKQMVSRKKLGNKNILEYTKNDFINIFKLNFDKLFFINKEDVKNKCNYNKLAEGIKIYTKIKEKIDQDFEIYVLNTSIFFLSEFKTINQKYLNENFVTDCSYTN